MGSLSLRELVTRRNKTLVLYGYYTNSTRVYEWLHDGASVEFEIR